MIVTLTLRDRLKTEQRFNDFKKQRNKVKSLMRSAKKSYLKKKLNRIKVSPQYGVINEITNKSQRKINRSATTISPNKIIFNWLFLTLAET